MISLTPIGPSQPTETFLICYDQQAADYLYNYVDPKDVIQFDETWFKHSLFHLATPSWNWLPPIRVGSLYWPTGASRFAVGYYLVDDTRLTTLKPIIYGNNGPNRITLTIDERKTPTDTTLGSIKAAVYCLPPRPLANITGQNGLYLLTVVDQRYFYWFNKANSIASGISWLSYLSSIMSSMNPTGGFVVDTTIPAAYQAPSNRFTNYNQPLPLVLDAAAKACGQRVAVDLNGLMFSSSYIPAKSAQADNITKINPSGDRTKGDFIPMAGGVFQSSTLTNSISVPNGVTTIFGKQTGTYTYATVPYAVTTPLASITPDGYSNTVVGFAGQKVIVGDLTADSTSGGPTPINIGDLLAYAQQTATDYYQWQLGHVDQVLTGICNWKPNALCGMIEWCYQESMVYTRIQRDRWNERDLGMFRQSDCEGYLSAWPGNCSLPTCTTFPIDAQSIPGYGPYKLLGTDQDGCLVWYPIVKC